MLPFLSVLVILVCVLLVAVILLQNPKGGGLNGSAFGGAGSSLFGARQTGDYLEKGTWYLIILLAALTLGTKFFIGSSRSQAAATQTESQFEWSKYTTAPSTSLNPTANQKPNNPNVNPGNNPGQSPGISGGTQGNVPVPNQNSSNTVTLSPDQSGTIQLEPDGKGGVKVVNPK